MNELVLELWVGGVASFCIIVLVCFAYSFSGQFFNQYPIEQTSNSYFACDISLRNAKFGTSLQSLSIPPAESEQEMFDLLNNQALNLNVDFTTIPNLHFHIYIIIIFRLSTIFYVTFLI